MPDSLDLSNYPKITPTVPEQVAIQVEVRSSGLRRIKQIMENLLSAMESYLVDLQDLDATAKLLEQQRSELVEMEKQIKYAHTQLEKKEDDLKGQLEYIKTWNAEHGS